mmetsp:Transcript_54962/g.145090  ORF Transcript_54962/g.145090 Transcript_54962/m.145090 type:complete len:130 (-) Transcript_54962:43-432(-)
MGNLLSVWLPQSNASDMKCGSETADAFVKRIDVDGNWEEVCHEGCKQSVLVLACTNSNNSFAELQLTSMGSDQLFNGGTSKINNDHCSVNIGDIVGSRYNGCCEGEFRPPFETHLPNHCMQAIIQEFPH